MTRDDVIRRVLGSIANDSLRRGCRSAASDADAVAFLRARMCPSGYCGPDGAWHGQTRGVAYSQPGEDALPRPEDGYPLIRWPEIARFARAEADQLTLEVPA